MKKVLSFIIIMGLFIGVFGTSLVNAVEFDIPSESAILIDSATGQVLFEKDAHKKLPPASITKIMTLLLAMEAIERGEASLEDKVSVSAFAESMGGSQIYLSTKDRVTLGLLLKAITIASANDACVALGEFIGGTEDNFVRMMNKRAKELGMKDTHFANTTGLPDDDHYTTAFDISIMSRELIKYDQIREWAKIWHDKIQLYNRQASITNTNTLIKSYSGLDGIKTGHTTEAGFCLSASVERNGFRLISVVLNTASEQLRNEATTRLLDYGFRAFEHKVVVKENESIPDIVINQGKELTVDTYTAKSLQLVVLKGTATDLRGEAKSLEKDAPIKKGEKVGELIIYQNEKELGRVDLLSTEDVDKANIFVRLLRWLWGLIGRLIEQFKK